MGFVRIGHATLGSVGQKLESGTLTATKAHIYFTAHLVRSASSESQGCNITFNDNGSNYSGTRLIRDGTASADGRTYAGRGLDDRNTVYDVFIEGKVSNTTGKNHVCQGTTIATTAATGGTSDSTYVQEWIFKWSDTSNITSIEIDSAVTGNTWATSSSITVFGADDFSNPPSLSNGTIFEESDTGKHYMWDGSSAWNEIA